MLVCCKEMSWLIIKTWAIGSKHAQAERNAQALPFMAAAIDLMDLCDNFKDSKKVQLRLSPSAVQDSTFQPLSAQELSTVDSYIATVLR